MDEEVEKATRFALRRLGDVTYLDRCPLADLIAERTGGRPDGFALQQILCQAIAALEPAEDLPYLAKQQLRYDILRLTYLEQQSLMEVAQQLPLSERQYYRELKAAIQMVAQQILGNA